MKDREQVKSLLVSRNLTIKSLAQMLSEKLGKKYTAANLSGKLLRGRLTYNEMLIICGLLEYKIIFEDIKEY